MYSVLWKSPLQTVPHTTDPAGVVETILVEPNVPVTTGDTIAFYGEGIPITVGGGTDILSYPAPTAPPDAPGTFTLDAAGGFPVLSQDRTYPSRPTSLIRPLSLL
jgi:hypothetical protein